MSKVHVLIVTSVAESFRRAGLRFTREPIGIVVSDYSKEQIQAIRDEPNLQVKDDEVEPSKSSDEALAAAAKQETADKAAKKKEQTEKKAKAAVAKKAATAKTAPKKKEPVKKADTKAK